MFLTDINNHGEEFKCCGVGAHHQDELTERKILTILNMARVMMLHASIRWPEILNPSLSPLPVDYAALIFNHSPKHKTIQSPMDILTISLVQWHDFKGYCARGCPCYVLDSKWQNGQKLPKWKHK